MNIAKYSAYFHDGSIIDIQHKKNELLITMESAEISANDLTDKITLSVDSNLKGILYLEVVQSIVVDHELFYGDLQMLADIAGILDLEITNKKVHLFIEWINYPPKDEIEKYSDIVIEAKKIYWENISDVYFSRHPLNT